MRVLITGVTGFVGSHMAEFLADRRDVEVHGTCRRGSSLENIRPFEKKIRLSVCDWTDKKSAQSLIKKIKPRRVIHLAARASVAASWDAPHETLLTNILAELNLFEAVRVAGLKPVVLAAASSEEYGSAEPNELPIRETAPLRPANPYAVSKIAQDFLGYAYHRAMGLGVIRTRAFNHTGPRQSEDFAVSSFARQTALIEAGKQKPVMETGNLDVVRDYSDVRDVVRAYWLLTGKGASGEVYNIASGKGRRLSGMVDFFFRESRVKFSVCRRKDRIRPADPPAVIGDASKLRKRTGWSPRVRFETTLKDLLNYWRMKVA